jgi:hypothetical protein
MGLFSNLIFGKDDKQLDDQPDIDRHDEWQSDQVPDQPDEHHDQSGNKIIPEVYIERIEAHPSGDLKFLEIWAHLHNASEFPVQVTRVEGLKQRSDLGQFLQPNETHEVRIYRGQTPTNDAETRAMVTYKCTDNGDYFISDHLIEYTYQEHDGGHFYIPEEYRYLDQVRDL